MHFCIGTCSKSETPVLARISRNVSPLMPHSSSLLSKSPFLFAILFFSLRMLCFYILQGTCFFCTCCIAYLVDGPRMQSLCLFYCSSPSHSCCVNAQSISQPLASFAFPRGVCEHLALVVPPRSLHINMCTFGLCIRILLVSGATCANL